MTDSQTLNRERQEFDMFRAHSDANHAELLDDIVSAEEQVISRQQTADSRQQTADIIIHFDLAKY